MSLYDSIRVSLCVCLGMCDCVLVSVSVITRSHSMCTLCEKLVSYIYIQASSGSLRCSLRSLRRIDLRLGIGDRHGAEKDANS